MQEGFGGLKLVERNGKCKGDSIEEGFYQDHFVLFDDAFTEALHRWATKKTFVFYFLQIRHNSSLLGLPSYYKPLHLALALLSDSIIWAYALT